MAAAVAAALPLMHRSKLREVADLLVSDRCIYACRLCNAEKRVTSVARELVV